MFAYTHRCAIAQIMHTASAVVDRIFISSWRPLDALLWCIHYTRWMPPSEIVARLPRALKVILTKKPLRPAQD